MAQALVRVGTVEEIREAGRKVVRVGTVPVLVLAHEGAFVAIDNRCPHMGFPLHDGDIDDGMIDCHWHHARFDVTCGATLDPWADDVDGYRVEVVLIAGGSGKGEDYHPLCEVMGAVRHVVTMGAEGPAIAAALAGVVSVTAAPDLTAAVAAAADLAAPDATVLLSPACASFDMFTGYRQRGEAFTAAAVAAGAENLARADQENG